MITVGDKTLCVSETLLVKDDEEINVTSLLDNWELKLTIVISSQPQNSGPTASWRAVSSNHARIDLKGWGVSLGTSTDDPINLGYTDTTNRDILVSICNHRIGNINRLDFQIYLGGAK